jgi:hypothetical protein
LSVGIGKRLMSLSADATMGCELPGLLNPAGCDRA